jgi:hypothetical protein
MKTLLGSYAILMSALLIPFSAQASKASDALKAHQIYCSESMYTDDETHGTQELAEVTIQLDAAGKATSLKIDREASDEMPAIHSIFRADEDSVNHTVEPLESETITNSAYESILARNLSGDVVQVKVNDHAYSGWAGSTMEMAFGGKTFSTEEGGHMVSCTGQVKFKAGKDSLGDLEGDDGELLP